MAIWICGRRSVRCAVSRGGGETPTGSLAVASSALASSVCSSMGFSREVMS